MILGLFLLFVISLRWLLRSVWMSVVLMVDRNDGSADLSTYIAFVQNAINNEDISKMIRVHLVEMSGSLYNCTMVSNMLILDAQKLRNREKLMSYFRDNLYPELDDYAYVIHLLKALSSYHESTIFDSSNFSYWFR